MQTLQCPQCGGQLDPGATHGGVNRCPYCSSAMLMAEGQLRKLTSYALTARKSAEECREELLKQLPERGFEDLPEVEIEEATATFLVRRGHVRIRPKTQGNKQMEKDHEWVQEGYFGVPLTEEFPLGVFHAADTSDFGEGPDRFPDDLEGQLLRFGDAAMEGMVEQWRQRTLDAHISFRDWEERATWSDDVATLTVPVASLTFRQETKNTMRKAWSDTNDEGVYGATYSLHDGAELRHDLPKRHGNLVVVIVVIFLVAFLGVPLLILLITGILSLLAAVAT